MVAARFLESPTRYMLFTGKGGVGKTSLSCAAAIALADSGRRVLLVSTDPASNLDEVLETKLSSTPTPVAGANGLFAMNVDPIEAARQYREKMIAPYRGVLPEASIRSIEEQLSGACTVEIAAFDAFSRLVGDSTLSSDYEHIVLDTAPTGHTLRLLSLPSAWSNFIESNTGGTSCLGPLSGLQKQRELYESVVRTLADAAKTTIVLVSRPEHSALREAARTREELQALGIANHHLALNGLFTADDESDPVAASFGKRCAEAIRLMPLELAALPTTEIALFASGLSGVGSLRKMLRADRHEPYTLAADSSAVSIEPVGITLLIEEIAQSGRGVIMTMGKGGVGKTTIASAIAVALARKGHRVHLSTTDPASHLDQTLSDSIPGLSVGRIDAQQEVKSYAAEVMETAGSNLDAQARDLLQEDLRSPCTEEIAVFRAFAREVENGKDSFVVLDTAPTGHTLLLLDATESYHREVTRTLSDIPESVRKLLPRLRDPDYTKILIVTLPEATPVHEAAQLQQDLKRAGIDAHAWVVNQSLIPLEVTDAVLSARRQSEGGYIREVCETHCENLSIVPWLAANGGYVEWLTCVAADATEWACCV